MTHKNPDLTKDDIVHDESVGVMDPRLPYRKLWSMVVERAVNDLSLPDTRTENRRHIRRSARAFLFSSNPLFAEGRAGIFDVAEFKPSKEWWDEARKRSDDFKAKHGHE